jgi:hypothetical protein
VYECGHGRLNEGGAWDKEGGGGKGRAAKGGGKGNGSEANSGSGSRFRWKSRTVRIGKEKSGQQGHN